MATLSKPEVTPEQQEAYYRMMRRQYVTITHGSVIECGHKAKFSRTQDPSNNCIFCWEAYFVTAVDLEFIHAVITQKGVKELVRLKGTKFTKMFHGFLSSKLLPALEAEIQTEKAAPVQIEGGTFGGSNESGEVQASSITEQAAG